MYFIPSPHSLDVQETCRNSFSFLTARLTCQVHLWYNQGKSYLTCICVLFTFLMSFAEDANYVIGTLQKISCITLTLLSLSVSKCLLVIIFAYSLTPPITLFKYPALKPLVLMRFDFACMTLYQTKLFKISGKLLAHLHFQK